MAGERWQWILLIGGGVAAAAALQGGILSNARKNSFNYPIRNGVCQGRTERYTVPKPQNMHPLPFLHRTLRGFDAGPHSAFTRGCHPFSRVNVDQNAWEMALPDNGGNFAVFTRDNQTQWNIMGTGVTATNNVRFQDPYDSSLDCVMYNVGRILNRNTDLLKHPPQIDCYAKGHKPPKPLGPLRPQRPEVNSTPTRQHQRGRR